MPIADNLHPLTPKQVYLLYWPVWNILVASPIQKSPLGINMINNSSKEILTTPSSRAASFKEQEIELQNVEDIQANEFETDLKEIQKCIDNGIFQIPVIIFRFEQSVIW